MNSCCAGHVVDTLMTAGAAAVLGLERTRQLGARPQVLLTHCCAPRDQHLSRALCSGEQRKPKEVDALSGVHITQAAIGGWHCLALDDKGQVGAACAGQLAACVVVQS